MIKVRIQPPWKKRDQEGTVYVDDPDVWDRDTRIVVVKGNRAEVLAGIDGLIAKLVSIRGWAEHWEQ